MVYVSTLLFYKLVFFVCLFMNYKRSKSSKFKYGNDIIKHLICYILEQLFPLQILVVAYDVLLFEKHYVY